MQLQHIIVHEVAKAPLAEPVSRLRDQENPVDAQAERVSSQLAGLFTAVSIGGFVQPEAPGLPPTGFESLLRTYFDGLDFSDFVAFSRAAAAALLAELARPTAQQAKGGYLLLNHYTQEYSHFLSVVLLRMRTDIGLGDDLSFTEVDELDLDTLHMAARINLTEWREAATGRYIAFKIGRQARGVTQYFSEFIGCQETSAARVDTKSLVDATKAFCRRRGLDETQTNGARRAVKDLCQERMADQAPILLDEISTLLDARYPPRDDGEPGLLLRIAQQEFGLTNRLPVIDKRGLRSLVRYQGSTSRLSISFDAELLEQGKVIFQQDSRHLIITELPEDLLAELDRSAD